MNRTIINELRLVQEYPAVSILAPTHRSAPQNRGDRIVVRNLIADARRELLAGLSSREASFVLDPLEAEFRSIDWEHTSNGVALYADVDGCRRYELPIAPKLTVQVSSSFAVRELVRAVNRTWRYRALVLSDHATTLFDGARDHLVEVVDGFPISYTGPGGAEALPGGFGRTISSHRDERRRQFFRRVASGLARHHTSDPLPLVVTGVDRYLAFWAEVAPQFRAAVPISGNFDGIGPHELSVRLWPEVDRYFTAQRHRVLDELDATSTAWRVLGFDEVLTAAQQARIDLLVAPEDVTVPARVDTPHVELLDHAAPGAVPDIVEHIVDLVIASGGRVVFLTAEQLECHGSITATLRF
jgi:hypothetical protein